MLFDLPLEELAAFQPVLRVPEDLDSFWAETLAVVSGATTEAHFVEVDSGLRVVTTYDVTFAGHGGTSVKGWLHVPRDAAGPLPTVVEYLGYNNGRGLAHQNVFYAAAGYAHFIMDTRGQGVGGIAGGDTVDADPDAGLVATKGLVTRGILDRATYYYKRVYVDAVRAIDAAASHPAVDSDRIVVTGLSQGGGIAIAAAALSPRPIGAMPDVPFLCNIERAVSLTDNPPYSEFAEYLTRYRDRVETVMTTLSYFDAAVLAALADVPALFSVGLMDRTCPPSTVYSAFNRWGSDEREMVVYPFNAHEGGQEYQQLEKLRWLRTLLQ